MSFNSNPDSFTVFAHRGLNRVAPENTLAAFSQAHAAGIGWVETDVDVLGDGTAILIHDSTLDRTTDHTGSYCELQADDLGAISAGSWMGPEFASEPIPTFDAFLTFLVDMGMNANIELKPNEHSAESARLLIEKVAAGIESLEAGPGAGAGAEPGAGAGAAPGPQIAAGADLGAKKRDFRPKPQIIVSSFSPVMLAEFKARTPQVEVGLLLENHTFSPAALVMAQMIGASHIHPQDAGLSAPIIAQIRQAGFGVNVWTVNSVARANQLRNWGATGVFTDIADQMRHLIR